MPRRRMGPGSNGGRGFVECEASGFLRRPQDIVRDVRQGDVGRDFADLTPGFGTWHPRDKYDPGPMDDPTPVEHVNPPLAIEDLPSAGGIDPDFKPPTLDGAPKK